MEDKQLEEENLWDEMLLDDNNIAGEFDEGLLGDCTPKNDFDINSTAFEEAKKETVETAMDGDYYETIMEEDDEEDSFERVKQ